MEDFDTWLTKKPPRRSPVPPEKQFDRWFSGKEDIISPDEIQRGAVSEAFSALGAGIISTGESMMGFGEMVGVPAAGLMRKGYQKLGELEALQRPEYLEEGTILEHPERLSDWRWWTRALGENVPNMAAMMLPGLGAMKVAQLLGWGTRAIKLAGLAGAWSGATVIEGGAAYNQAKQEMARQGYSDQEIEQTATAEGLTIGAVNGILEMLPFKALFLNRVGAPRIIKRFVRQAFIEGTTETAQEAVSVYVERLGHKPDQTLKDNIGRLLESGIIGAALGGGAGVTLGKYAVEEEPAPTPELDTDMPTNADLVKDTAQEEVRETAETERAAADEQQEIRARAEALVDDIVREDEEETRAIEEATAGIAPEIAPEEIAAEPIPTEEVIPEELARQVEGEKPVAEFAYYEELGVKEGLLKEPKPLFNIVDELGGKTTAGMERLQELGYEIPEYPTYKQWAAKAPPAKESWEMTKEEYEKSLGMDTRFTPPQPKRMAARLVRLPDGTVWHTDEHGKAVVDALSEGETVPEEVLKQYPELKEKPVKAEAETRPVTELTGDDLLTELDRQATELEETQGFEPVKEEPTIEAKAKETVDHVKAIIAGAKQINDILGVTGALTEEEIDKEKYGQIKPILTEMWNHAKAANQTGGEFVSLVLEQLGVKAKAYFRKFIKEEVGPELEKEAPTVVEMIESPHLEWESFLRTLSKEEKELASNVIPPDYRGKTYASVRAQIDLVKKTLSEKKPAIPEIKREEAPEGEEIAKNTWDKSLTNTGRFEVAQSMGWNKKDSERISKTLWIHLSPAAKRVLVNNKEKWVEEEEVKEPGAAPTEIVPFEERTQEEKQVIEEYNKKMTPEEWKKEYAKREEPHYAEEKEPSPLASEMIKDLDKEGIKQGNILEIGAGNGRDSIFMAKKGHVVTGIDIVPKAIEMAKQNAKGIKNITFEVGDAENLKFEPESFDGVYSVAALHATPIRFTFREIFRVLKPGGLAKLFLYTRTKTGKQWISYWTPGEIKQYAKEEGFTIEKFREGKDTQPLEIPGIEGKIEQETHLTITTLRKPKEKIPWAEDLAAYGLTVTKGKTNTGKTVWNVAGNTKVHKEAINAAGGRWYGLKKVWSFYDSDPTDKLLEILGKTEEPAKPPSKAVEALTGVKRERPALEPKTGLIPAIGDRIRFSNEALATIKAEPRMLTEVQRETQRTMQIKDPGRYLVEVKDVKGSVPEGWKGQTQSSARANVREADIVALKRKGEKEWIPVTFEKVLTKPEEEAKIKVKEGEEREPTHEIRAPGEGALEGVPPGPVPGPEAEREPGRGPVPGPGKREEGPPRPAGEAPEERPLHGAPGPPGGRGIRSEGVHLTAPRKERARRTPPGRPSVKNYHITKLDELEAGGKWTKFEQNTAAIRLLKQIEADQRHATVQEQASLVKYSGWGQFPDVFNLGYAPEESLKRRQEHLKELLTDEEYEAARASTVNAFYTSPVVVEKMYKLLHRIGFRGGRILEPSVGTGHFIGLMPDNLADNSQVTGIEIDSLSTRIARQLYSGADLRHNGFEEVKLPDQYFDLAVSNVPFGDYKLTDPDYNKFNFFIHDYFFAKAMDKVRPGGLVMFITSAGTMNSQRSERLRTEMNKHADLLGAIRLPGQAFAKMAGTEVTTDIIVLRKRLPGEKPAGKKWTEQKPSGVMGGRYGDVDLKINEYFVDNPDMMLGTIVDDKLHPGRAGLKADERDLGKALDQAIKKFRPGAFKEPEIVETVDIEKLVPAPEDLKAWAWTVTEDGNLAINVQGKLVSRKLPERTTERIKGMIEIRDATRTVFREQILGEEEKYLAARKKLNQVYDRFVKKQGYLNDAGNKQAFADDPDLPLLLALEKDYIPPISKEKKRSVANKTDIFFKRTIPRYEKVVRAETVQDALLYSLNDRGRLDLDYMSQLVKKDHAEIITDLKGLIYRDPLTKLWKTNDDYLSGNVREKLETARTAAKTQPEFGENVKALEAIQPKDLSPSEIDARLGSPWIPLADIEQFVSELLETSSDNVRIRHSDKLALWSVGFVQPWEVNRALNTSEYGTGRAAANYLIEQALNAKTPTIYDEAPDGKRVVNTEATMAAREKHEKIRNKFKKWLWKDSDRAKRLARKYNDEFNNTVIRNYDGSHLSLPGAATEIAGKEFQLMPHQKNGIWRIIQSGNTLLGHVVGGGKTYTMVGAGMEMKRLGIMKKPMYVVPNHIVQQFSREYLGLYPGANILVATRKDLEAKRRKVFMSKIATGNWDAVIVAHSSFTLLPMSKRYTADYIRAEIQELTDAISEQDRDRSNRIVKQLEKAKKRLEDRLKRLIDSGMKDNTVTFEELGIDFLFIDEAHNFKNLFFVTKMQRIAGLQNAQAKRSTDMFMKIRYLNTLRPQKSVVFATGTPVSNTLCEMFTMQRYLQMPRLEDNGIAHFDAWAQSFGETITGIELSPDGRRYRLHSRFARFSNIPELLQMFGDVADIRTQEMLKLPIPEIKGGKPQLVSAKASEMLRVYVDEIIARMEKIRSGTVDPRDDNMLKCTNDGRKAALDMRVVDPAIPDEPGSKTNLAVDKIHEIWKNTADVRGTQMVFCDLSVPLKYKKKLRQDITTEIDKALETGRDAQVGQDDFIAAIGGDFSVYDDIKGKLLARGIPENEIAFIHDYNTDVKKVKLFDQVNRGDIRILMGSTGKMGEGTNAQLRMIALHHLDAPWKPAHIEQREGRILRQGNLNKEVEIYRYVTEQSFDAYIWQLIEHKAKMINQVMRGDITVRSIEDVGMVALTAAEAKAAATGNPLIMEKAGVDAEVAKLTSLERSHEGDQIRLRWEIETLIRRIESYKDQIGTFDKDLTKVEDLSGDKFSITLEGKSYNKRPEAAEMLDAINRRILERKLKAGDRSGKDIIGTISGFDIAVGPHLEDGSAAFSIKAAGTYHAGYTTSMEGAISRLENAVKGLQQEYSLTKKGLTKAERDKQDLKAQLGIAFPHEDRLNELVIRQAEIERILRPEEKKDEPVTTDQDLEKTEAAEAPKPGEDFHIWSDDRYRAIKGEKVEILPWIETFIAKSPDTDQWTVYEKSCGLRIHDAPTRQKALEETREMLERHTEEELKKLRDAHIDEHGAAPGTIVAGAPQYATVEQPPPFFSQLIRSVETIEDMPRKVQSLKKWLQRRVKPDEVKWMGVDQWIEENQKQGKIEKKAFLDFLKANELRIQERIKEEAPDVAAIQDHALLAAGNVIEDLLDSNNRFDKTAEQALNDWIDSGASDESAETQLDKLLNQLPAPQRRTPADIYEDEIGSAMDSAIRTTQYETYALPGGKEYRELLFTLPVEKEGKTLDDIARERYKKSYNELSVDEKSLVSLQQRVKEGGYAYQYYKSAHWKEPNVLAHVRFNERTDTEGNRVLFLEEVQSDWLQAAKKEGFKKTFTELPVGWKVVPHETAGGWTVIDESGIKLIHSVDSKDSALKRGIEYANMRGVPLAPFAKSWHEFIMKRMLRWAAEHGFDKLAWTTGEQQAERYDLGKHIDKIQYIKNPSGTYNLAAIKGREEISGLVRDLTDISLGKIEELLGKSVATKIRDGGKQGEISGLDLKIGGEGMTAFYDRLLPGFMNKYVKQWDARLGETKVLAPVQGFPTFTKDRSVSVHSVDITPQMQKAVVFEGQPLFAKAPRKEKPYTPSLEDVQGIFKNQAVTQSKEGHFRVTTQHGGVVEIRSVDEIDTNNVAFQMGYGRARKAGEAIAGKYESGRIDLHRDLADRWILAHESYHFMESAGIISPADIRVIKNKIKALARKGEFTPLDPANVGFAEDRAAWVTDQLRGLFDVKSTTGRILMKIRTFLDRLLEMFGIRTAPAIVRKIETGRVFNEPVKARFSDLPADLKASFKDLPELGEPLFALAENPSGEEARNDVQNNRSFVNKLFETGDPARHRVGTLVQELQAQVQTLAGEPSRKKIYLGIGYKPKLKRSLASDYLDRAMMVYRDLQNNPDKAGEFRTWAENALKNPETPARDKVKIRRQIKILDMAQNLTEEQKKFAGQMGTLFTDAFNKAKAHKIVKTFRDNYVRRIWKLPEGKEDLFTSTGSGYGFKTFTTAALPRKFDTILDGWINGYELKIEGLTNSYARYMTELVTIITNKAFIQRGTATKDINGNSLFSTGRLPGYAPLSARGFAVWRWAGKAEIEAELTDEDALIVDTYGRKFFATIPERIPESWSVYKDEAALKPARTFDTEEGAEEFAQDKGYTRIERNLPMDVSTLFEKQPLYTPAPLAEMINKMTATESWIFNVPVARNLLRLNTSLKSWILLSSFFHHMAGTRSWIFGVHHGWKKANPVRAYKDGLKKIEDCHPLIDLGIKNGLTLGELQDWAEHELRAHPGFTERAVKYLGLEKTGKVIEYGKFRRERFTDSLFKKFFAGLKAEAFVIEYTHEMQKAQERYTTGRSTTPPNVDAIAERVARLINADFGGLHLKRMGRNPSLQNIGRLLLLAPDWTESNFRTVSGMIPGLNDQIGKLMGDVPGPPELDKIFRKFWGRVILRIAVITILSQMFLNGKDESDEFLEEQMFSNRFNKFRWTEVDVTKLYNMLGIDTEGRRKTFSLGGHFFDPLKLMDPFRLIKHKGSPVTRIGGALMSASDWAERPFTGVRELMRTGKTVKKSAFQEKEEAFNRLPSTIVNLTVNMQPIQVGHLIRYLQGEEDGLTALMHSAGAAVHTAWKPRLETPIVRAEKGEDTVFAAIEELIDKKALTMAPPSRHLMINGVSYAMSYDQYEEYLKGSSSITRRKLAPVVDSKRWKVMSDSRKVKLVMSVIRNARKKVRSRVKKMLLRQRRREITAESS